MNKISFIFKLTFLTHFFNLSYSFNKINTNNNLLNDYPFILGSYNLRCSDNKLFKTGSLTNLILNKNNTIKFKTILNNGFFAYKTSRSGEIIQLNKKKNLLNDIMYTLFGIKLNRSLKNQDILIILKFNNTNKYSYSFLGIEFPEFKYAEKYYNVTKHFLIIYNDNSLYIHDNDLNYFYIFDLALPNDRRPFTETQLNTFIFTQLIGFIITAWLNSIHLEFLLNNIN